MHAPSQAAPACAFTWHCGGVAEARTAIPSRKRASSLAESAWQLPLAFPPGSFFGATSCAVMPMSKAMRRHASAASFSICIDTPTRSLAAWTKVRIFAFARALAVYCAASASALPPSSGHATVSSAPKPRPYAPQLERTQRTGPRSGTKANCRYLKVARAFQRGRPGVNRRPRAGPRCGDVSKGRSEAELVSFRLAENGQTLAAKRTRVDVVFT